MILSLFVKIMGFLQNIFLSFNFNWLDFVLIAVIAFYAFEGYSLGFIGALADFLNFIFSFAVGLRYYFFYSSILVKIFSLSQGISNAAGFFIAATLSQIVIGFILKKIFIQRSPARISLFKNKLFKNMNNILGIIPGALSGLILIAFLLTLIMSFPLSRILKNVVSSSKIGEILVSNTQFFEKDLNKVFGGAVNETLNFLTVEPQSDKIVNLHFKSNNLFLDKDAENKMLILVNNERKKQGLNTLSSDDKLKEVGRNHCKDMLQRGYFSHYTREGLSPFDRMEQANVSYRFAGENLALAPNVTLAMKGLMGSVGHRANILSIDFGRIGVGIIDGGIYGEMFCQEFTD